jgi:CspA family cold shock protein
MKLIVKIILSVAVAAVAAAITTWYAGDGHAAPVLFVAFCCATVITALLVSIPGSKAAPEPGKSAQKSQRAPRQAAAKSAPRDTATDGKREHGVVKWFNVSKGFGFITKDDGEEIFVHFRSIRGGGRRGLRDGQQVTFVVADSDKGPQAEDVEGLE